MLPISSRNGVPGPAVSLILAAACWGTGTVLSRVAVDGVAPLLLLPLQLATSLVFLVLAMRRRGEPIAVLTRPRVLGALGILNPGLAYALGLLGLAQLSASVAVVVWATEPAMVALLALPLLGERLRLSVVGLSAVAIGGVAILAGDPAASGPAAGGTAAGIALIAAAVACCAIYTIAARRWLPDAPATLGVVVAQQAAALAFAVLLLGLAAVVAPGSLAAPRAAAGVLSTTAAPALVGSVVASGLVYYGLAFWLYLDGLRRLPASLAATAFYLIPVFGLAAAFALGERLEPRAWAGAAVVLVAVSAIGWVSRTQASRIGGEGGTGSLATGP